MAMHTEVTCISYSVDMEDREFLAITALDDKNRNVGRKTLHDIMGELFRDITQIEYNGHFGPAFFYTIDNDDNTLMLRENVEKEIAKYVKKGLKLLPIVV